MEDVLKELAVFLRKRQRLLDKAEELKETLSPEAARLLEAMERAREARS